MYTGLDGTQNTLSPISGSKVVFLNDLNRSDVSPTVSHLQNRDGIFVTDKARTNRYLDQDTKKTIIKEPLYTVTVQQHRDTPMPTSTYTEVDRISTALFAVRSCNGHHTAEQLVQNDVSKQKWELVFKTSKRKQPYVTIKWYLDTHQKYDLGSPRIEYVFLTLWTKPAKKKRPTTP